MTPSEEILAQYKETKAFSDSLGRKFKMRVLKPADSLRIIRLAASENQTIVMNFLIAASVSHLPSLPDGDGVIGEYFQPLPKNIIDLEDVLNRLGRKGMKAATKAYVELNKVDDDDDDDDGEEDAESEAVAG